jgi:hypothetical protein
MQYPLIAGGCSGDEHAWILKLCHCCNHPCQIKIIWNVLWPWKCYLSWTQVVWLMHTSKQISQWVHSDWLHLSNFFLVNMFLFWFEISECDTCGCWWETCSEWRVLILDVWNSMSCELAMRRTSFSVASIHDWPCSFPLHSGTWSFNKLLFFTYFPGASLLLSLIHHSS